MDTETKSKQSQTISRTAAKHPPSLPDALASPRFIHQATTLTSGDTRHLFGALARTAPSMLENEMGPRTSVPLWHQLPLNID